MNNIRPLRPTIVSSLKDEYERAEYARRQLQKAKMRRQHADELEAGRDRRDIEREEVAYAIANMQFPRFIFDKWCQATPPKASPTNKDILIWHCEACHVTVMPSVVTHGYIRGNCLCQKQETEKRLKQEADEKQEALRRKKIDDLMKNTSRFSWIGPQFGLENKSFENFDLDRVSPLFRDDVEFAVLKAQAFAANPVGNLLVYGPHGTGKTHLMATVLNEHYKRGKNGLYTSALDLFEKIETNRITNESSEELENKMKWADMLIIDEIDRVRMTDARFGVYYRVVNYRSQKESSVRGSAPTVMICNQTIKDSIYELEGFLGTPTVSRMQIGLNLIFVPGEDQRAKL